MKIQHVLIFYFFVFDDQYDFYEEEGSKPKCKHGATGDTENYDIFKDYLSTSSHDDDMEAEVMDIEADDLDHDNNDRADNDLYYNQLTTAIRGMMQDLGIGGEGNRDDDSSDDGEVDDDGDEDQTILECDGHSHDDEEDGDGDEEDDDAEDCEEDDCDECDDDDDEDDGDFDENDDYDYCDISE